MCKVSSLSNKPFRRRSVKKIVTDRRGTDGQKVQRQYVSPWKRGDIDSSNDQFLFSYFLFILNQFIIMWRTLHSFKQYKHWWKFKAVVFEPFWSFGIQNLDFLLRFHLKYTKIWIYGKVYSCHLLESKVIMFQFWWMTIIFNTRCTVVL